MTRYKVTAPNPRYSGEVAGLYFRDGSANAEYPADQVALDYCRRRGYLVEAADAEGEALPERPGGENPDPDALPPGDDGTAGDADEPSEDPLSRPADYASKADWVAYAVDVDPGLTREAAEAATKNELIEKYGKDDQR